MPAFPRGNESQLPTMILSGVTEPMQVDGTPRPLVNYPDKFWWGVDSDQYISRAEGRIRIPSGGKWEMVALVVGHQGANVKDEEMFLSLDINSGTTQQIICSQDVATNRTDWRTFSVSFTRLFEENDDLRLIMSATGNMGTFVFETITFELHKRLLL